MIYIGLNSKGVSLLAHIFIFLNLVLFLIKNADADSHSVQGDEECQTGQHNIISLCFAYNVYNQATIVIIVL